MICAYRSLRRRLNTDVTPHLQRFANHARSEDEFMAAAARLLLNMQERQLWLSSWATRRHVDGGDTSPAELEGVAAVPAAAAAPTAVQRAFNIAPAVRERVRQALANEVGPIADLLLDNESHRVDSMGELLSRLELHLDGAEQRARFRSAADLKSSPHA